MQTLRRLALCGCLLFCLQLATGCCFYRAPLFPRLNAIGCGTGGNLCVTPIFGSGLLGAPAPVIAGPVYDAPFSYGAGAPVGYGAPGGYEGFAPAPGCTTCGASPVVATPPVAHQPMIPVGYPTHMVPPGAGLPAPPMPGTGQPTPEDGGPSVPLDMPKSSGKAIPHDSSLVPTVVAPQPVTLVDLKADKSKLYAGR